MTKLEAVNICLSGLGEPSVPDLDADGGLDVVMVLSIIEERTRYLCNKNWYWNTETKKLTPNEAGEIVLPTGTLRADTVASDRYVNVVKRGNRLYNLDTNSFSFSRPLFVEYSFTVAFDDMPEVAQGYVTSYASLLSQQRILGSESLDKFLQGAAKDAWVDLVRDNANTADYNMLSGSTSTGRVLNRGVYPRGGAA